MRFLALVLSAMSVSAQLAPVGLVRGSLLECEPEGEAGALTLRTGEHRVFRFVYDARTYIERERKRIAAGALQPGEQIEILSDRGPSGQIRYARIIHVLGPEKPAIRVTPLAVRARAASSALESILQRGNLTFTGIISQREAGHLVLRTRIDGDKLIRLRPDTRFLEGGSLVESSALTANTRVFVRAGRSLENELEAYSIIWGQILDPKRR